MRTPLSLVIICALTIHLVTGQQSCTSGFISLSELTTLAPTGSRGGMCNTVCERTQEQRLIPAINFTCNGVITKWIFGADFDFEDLQVPELQLWRLQSGTTYTKVGSCSIQTTVSENDDGRVYECVPTSELRFEAGDVLGIFQPRGGVSRLTMYYDIRSGPTNYIDRDVDTAATTFDTTSSAEQTENAIPLVTVEILADCGSLPDPENGQVTLTGTTEGSTATYRCNTGYSLMGVNMRTCQSDGQWSDQPPVCTPMDCGGLTRPENGQVTLTGTTLNSEATYSCEQGYNLIGESVRTCQSDGMWSDQPPVCTPVDCGSLTDPENGRVTLTGTTLNSIATYSCDTGYNVMGTSTRICRSSGMWSGQPPICTPVTSNVIPSSIATQVIVATASLASQAFETAISTLGETVGTPTSVTALPTSSPSLVDGHDDSQVLLVSVGAVGGLVAALSILVMIIMIIVCVRRKQATAHHNILEMTENESYATTNKAKELTIPTSQNEAYGTAAHITFALSENEVYSAVNEHRDEVTTSHNEAYGTAACNIIAVSENEAYSAVNERRNTSQNGMYPDQAPDEYDYVR